MNPSEIFEDEVVLAAPQYYLPQDQVITDARWRALAVSFRHAIVTGETREGLVTDWLLLALHIADPEDVNNGHFLPQYIQREPAEDPNRMTRLNFPVVQEPAESQANPKSLVQEPGQSGAQFALRTAYASEQHLRSAAIQGGPAASVAADVVSLRYWSFFAAWTMRLISKSHQNLTNSYDHMRNRFHKFYLFEEFDNVNVHVHAFRNLGALLRGAVKAQNTWVRVIAEYETTTPTHACIGMVTFLAILPLSFTGMHAYEQFLELVRVTHLPIRLLLTKMHIADTKPALTEIVSIIKHKEKTTATKQDAQHAYTTYYKYARIIGPQYYQPLQDDKCESLVYLLAVTILQFEKSPFLERIRDRSRIGDEQKQLLQNMARDIFYDANGGYGIVSSAVVTALEMTRQEDARVKNANAEGTVTAAEYRSPLASGE